MGICALFRRVVLLCPGPVQVDGPIDGAHLPKPFSNSVMRFETVRENRRAGAHLQIKSLLVAGERARRVLAP